MFGGNSADRCIETVRSHANCLWRVFIPILLVSSLSGCQTDANLTLDITGLVGGSNIKGDERETSQVRETRQINATTVSDDEICALLVVKGDNLHVWEREAIARDLTCIYPISTTPVLKSEEPIKARVRETQGVEQAETPSVDVISLPNSETMPSTASKMSKTASDKATEKRAPETPDLAAAPVNQPSNKRRATDMNSQNSNSENAKSTHGKICDGVRQKNFDAVKKALSLGLTCD